METTVTRRVDEIAAPEKQTLEGLLGRSLAAGEQVFILAYTPNAMPDEARRRAARASIEETISAAHEHAKTLGVTAAEADAAVDEATERLRHGGS